MSATKRYKLTRKLKATLETRGIVLICKHCDCPIHIGDEVESKYQNKGSLKIYHAKCYDDSHIDSPD